MVQKIISFVLSLLSVIGSISFSSAPHMEAEYPVREKVIRNMEKYVGVHSEVRTLGGVPTLFINDEPFPAAAYMTYLEDFNEYADFVNAGYDFFSMPVLFSGRWISATNGLKPFKKGIFDEKGKPDFAPLDEAVERILAVCPDAKIMPRVNISMPLWWEREHPDDVNILPDGSVLRESMYSEAWRETASQMLREFVQYVNTTDYASHIVGYQIAGGNTEEWFHFDLNAGYCKNAEKGFEKFLATYYPQVPFKGLPSLKNLSANRELIRDEYLTRFLEYGSFAVADAICEFASVVKTESGNNVVVGTFYGYSLEVTSSGHGTHALKMVLRDPNVDFICSPNSYIGVREPYTDWSEMYPADSVRLHGKLCFQECDIRTNLTVPLGQKDPETDPDGLLSAEIWHGLPTKELSMQMIEKSFVRQFVKGNGFWWFDMWGGWYKDADMMAKMQSYRTLYEEGLASESRKSVAQVAVFVDESAYKYRTTHSRRNLIYTQRKALSETGVPYDTYDVSDFEAVHEKYKAVVFLSNTKTAYMQAALNICKAKKIPFLAPSAWKEKFTAKQLRTFFQTCGAHCYEESGDILYRNENYLAIFATKDGEKTIRFGEEYVAVPLLSDGDAMQTDTLVIRMKKGECRLYRLEKK